MTAHDPSQGNADPNDLGGELREAVQAVLRDEPPMDWAEATLENLRRRTVRTAPRPLHRYAKWISMAAAACIVAGVMLVPSRLSDDGQDIVDKPPWGPKVTAISAQEGLDSLARPTLWAYRQAARQSPEALDELLERHAGELLRRSPEADLGALRRQLLWPRVEGGGWTPRGGNPVAAMESLLASATARYEVPVFVCPRALL